MEAKPALIELRGVRKQYARANRAAVTGLDLSVQPGEIFGFLGPNGAGKTTTIKILCGLLRPDAGAVRVAGVDLLSDPLTAKSRIGYVPDSPEMYDHLTGIEYLTFVADVHRVPGPQRQRRLADLAGGFQFEEALGDRIAAYSHGMRQKLAVIAALLHDPPLWVLDEPLTGLDPRSSRRLREMMAEHCAGGKTVFFSTHVLEVAERLCHRVGIINQGRLIACGSLDELRRTQGDTLESVFLELTEAS